jgi:hypothetical protein
MRRSGWLRGWQDWLILVAVAAAALVVVNMVMFEMNRMLQVEVSGRTQYIQQTVQLEALNREIVTAIANLATRNNDDALRTVLSQHGITINPAGPAVTAPQSGTSPAPSPTGKQSR